MFGEEIAAHQDAAQMFGQADDKYRERIALGNLEANEQVGHDG
jgi:hypothetical protein